MWLSGMVVKTFTSSEDSDTRVIPKKTHQFLGKNPLKKTAKNLHRIQFNVSLS